MENTPWKIEWTDALSMANPEIDAEHRHFISLVNELNDAIVGRLEKAGVQRIMGLILEDAIAHFAHEERLFAEKGYPNAQQHAQIHAELIGQFKQAMQQFQNAEFSREWIEIGLLIKKLLVSHVLEVDMQYRDFLRTD